MFYLHQKRKKKRGKQYKQQQQQHKNIIYSKMKNYIDITKACDEVQLKDLQEATNTFSWK